VKRTTTPRTETRGRKPDPTKIKAEVNSQWDRVSKKIVTRLNSELPATKADARRHVLKIAAEEIATAVKPVRASRKR